MDFEKYLTRQAIRMTRLSLVVVLHLSVFACSAIVSETTRGTLPTLPDNIKTRLVVREGAKVYTLTCPAEGAPMPLIVWTKDGESITPAWNRFRQMNNDRDLRIKNVALDDAGLYKCHAVNGFGSVDLEYTVVVVGKDEPPYEYNGDADDDDENFVMPELKGTGRAPFWIKTDQITEQSRAPLVRPSGSSIKLKCFANGFPVPDVHWYKDGILLDEQTNKESRWVLNLKSLQVSNSGKYACQAYNIYGSLNATFALDVKDVSPLKTEFEKSFMNTSIQEGQTATFQCKVRSTVTPTIKWIKKLDGGCQDEDNKTFCYDKVLYRVLEVNPPEATVYPNNTYMKQLVILNVKPKDAGWYFCVVPDSNGDIVNRSAHLKVIPLNHVEQAPVSVIQFSVYLLIGAFGGFVILCLVVCAICFLVRHQQRPSKFNNRPQPPSYPPPSVPASSQKASMSPYRTNMTMNSGSSNTCQPLAPSSKEQHQQAPHASPYIKDYKTYHHLDPMACVPLNSQCPSAMSDRELYETTPQPYELQLEHSDFSDCYDGSGGRVQHYPSMYSCR